MTTCTEKHHPNHSHRHGPNCGHTAVRHDDHVDYLHDGHLHHMHGDHVDEHVIEVTGTNPARGTQEAQCDHVHGPIAGMRRYRMVIDVDYVVNGRLHHAHGGRCDDHGPVPLA